MTRHVIFLCWGNICRSPMAEFMARAELPADLADVEFTSAGVSDEEHGGPLDPRAAAVLEAHGVPTTPHRAHVITAREAENADLVVAMEPTHVARLQRLTRNAQVRLLTSFNPDATREGVVDPWYGADEGFEDTYADIDAALPGLFEELRRTR